MEIFEFYLTEKFIMFHGTLVLIAEFDWLPGQQKGSIL